MPAIVAIPQVTEELLVQFGDPLSSEPSQRRFAEYLIGLLFTERQMVSDIACEFTAPPDQSCLNCWLTAAPWEPNDLNARRLEWLQQHPATRPSASPVGPSRASPSDRLSPGHLTAREGMSPPESRRLLALP